MKHRRPRRRLGRPPQPKPDGTIDIQDIPGHELAHPQVETEMESFDPATRSAGFSIRLCVGPPRDQEEE